MLLHGGRGEVPQEVPDAVHVFLLGLGLRVMAFLLSLDLGSRHEGRIV
jgi:hypothetical protein